MARMGRGRVSILGLVAIFWSLGTLLSPAGFGQEEVSVASAEASEGERPGYVTMDFKEADINTVLRLLSLKSGVNIVAGPEVKGTVTIRLEDVPWQQALEVVLRTYGYVYERNGNIIRVTTRDNLAQEEIITEVFTLNYTTATEAEKAIKDMLTERGRIKVADRTNTLVVSDIPTNLYKVGEIIKKLDQPTPQAYIDSKIVKTQVDEGENLGIKWSATDIGLSRSSTRPTTFPFSISRTDGDENISPFLEQFFPQQGAALGINPVAPNSFPIPAVAAPTQNSFAFGTLDFSTFTALLSMLQSRSNTKVVSNPRIVVLNNQTAKVKVGSEIPIPSFSFNQQTATYQVSNFSYRDVGVVLNVTPHINSAEEILVDLKPEVSSQGATVTFTPTLAAPSFDVTNAQTQVLIRSGETIAIGGLMEDKASVSEQRLPYLSSIPVLGKVFRSKRQTEGSSNRKVETIFFVTVTLIDTEGQPTAEKRQEKKNAALAAGTVGSQQMATPSPIAPTTTG